LLNEQAKSKERKKEKTHVEADNKHSKLGQKREIGGKKQKRNTGIKLSL
jgi:hypothetical protein